MFTGDAIESPCKEGSSKYWSMFKICMHQNKVTCLSIKQTKIVKIQVSKQGHLPIYQTNKDSVNTGI